MNLITVHLNEYGEPYSEQNQSIRSILDCLKNTEADTLQFSVFNKSWTTEITMVGNKFLDLTTAVRVLAKMNRNETLRRECLAYFKMGYPSAYKKRPPNNDKLVSLLSQHVAETMKREILADSDLLLSMKVGERHIVGLKYGRWAILDE